MPKLRLFRLYVPVEHYAWRQWRARVAAYQTEHHRPRNTHYYAADKSRIYTLAGVKPVLWRWDKTCWESGIKPYMMSYRWPDLLNRSAENCFQLKKGDQ